MMFHENELSETAFTQLYTGIYVDRTWNGSGDMCSK
jgi:hypothetical protein